MNNYRMKITLIIFLLLVFEAVSGYAAPRYDTGEIDVFQVKLPEGEKTGYLSIATGKWVIPPQFDSAYRFYDDRAVIGIKKKDNETLYGCIDPRSKIVIDPQYPDSFFFSEGLASVETNLYFNQRKYVYIDRNGKIVLKVSNLKPDRDSFYYNFHEGLAAVNDGKAWGYIDRTGKLVIQPHFTKIEPFSEGVAVVQDRGGKWGVINKSGEYIISPQYANLKSYSEGLAAAQLEFKQPWGFIDKTGKMVITPQFVGADSFHDGLASVVLNGESSYINGQSFVVSGKWGFINRNGEIVIRPAFDRVQEFKGEYAKAGIGKSERLFGADIKYGWIDKHGNWVVQPQFALNSVYFPKYKIVRDLYYYDIYGNKLDHYTNHMMDAYRYMYDQRYKEAEAAFRAALKINPQDKAASWGLQLIIESQKEL